MIASKKSDQERKECHIDLLNYIRDNPDIFLALDEEGFVQSEYDRKLRSGTLGQEWLTVLAKNKKIRKYKRGKVENRTRTELEDVHFDSDDKHCVRLVVVTECKRIVTEDRTSYTSKVCSILKRRENVFVHDTEGICEHILANHLPEDTST